MTSLPISRRAVLAAGAFLGLLGGALQDDSASAKSPPVFAGLIKGVAVGGYDPVAYFTQGKPVKGSEQITLEHMGATWRFASEANRDAFKAEPEKYSPRYGGYCAYATAKGYTAKGDPEAWSLYEGKLYLNYDKNVRTLWDKDKAGYVKQADSNWPGVLEK
jgi:YHS domain-containing protein